MPNRIIREGINSSSRINALSFGAEVLYRRLMSVADDYGRYYADPAAVRGACWPTASSKVTEKQVMAWMKELSAGPEPLVLLYQAKGCQFLQIQGFGQQIRSKSKFPEHDINLQSSCEQPDAQLISTSRSRSRYSESETKAKSEPVGSDEFEQFWNLYPRKIGKGAAKNAWQKKNPPLEQVLLAIKQQSESPQWVKDFGQFIPFPATWLNQERWLDDAGTVVAKPVVPIEPVCKCGLKELYHPEVSRQATKCEQFQPVGGALVSA